MSCIVYRDFISVARVPIMNSSSGPKSFRPEVAESPPAEPPFSEAGRSDSAGGGAVWTFLSNHTHVLLCIYKQSDITARQIAEAVGITERAVQRILSDLIQAGYLVREKRGRQNVYAITATAHLRHPLERHCEVGGLLAFLSSGRAIP
jgi:hypothetical protein